MILLLFNYALFGDPVLLIFGWIIAGIEAITAILKLFKVVFSNNKKIAEKIDKKINKLEQTRAALIEKRDTLRAYIAYEAVSAGEKVVPADPLPTIEDDPTTAPFIVRPEFQTHAADEGFIPEHIEEPAPAEPEIQAQTAEPEAVEEVSETAAEMPAEPAQAPQEYIIHIPADTESAELLKKLFSEDRKDNDQI